MIGDREGTIFQKLSTVDDQPWRSVMSTTREAYAASISPDPADDWIKLIRKLRWIGMEEEAQLLQQTVSVHGTIMGCVLAEPGCTD